MKKPNTKQILSIAFIVASITSLFFVPWLLVKAWLLPLPNSVQEQLNQALDYGYSGIIVYVDQADKPPIHYTAGWHNKTKELPAKADALFKIASISKLYDAVAITKLVSEGRLSLDKTLADYLPELVSRVAYAQQITLRMLVQHRSGIPNFTDTPNFWASPTETYQESLALILDQPANFKPGESYEYCNTNYLLLNKIMDKTLGYDNFRYIQEQILHPLNLSHTYASIKQVPLDQVMSGYHQGHPFDLKADDQGMLATAQDVGSFLKALNNGTLLTQEQQALYTSLYKYEHAGWVPGYQSFASYHKELDAVLVCFYSTTDPKLYLWNLSEIINNRIVKILKKQ